MKYDLAEVAAVARKAHAAGRNMTNAVATALGVTQGNARVLISRARRDGNDIPSGLPTKLQAGEAPTTRRAVVSVGAHTITRAEYMAATAHADRPLTESGIVRYHQSDTMRVIGGWR